MKSAHGIAMQEKLMPSSCRRCLSKWFLPQIHITLILRQGFCVEQCQVLCTSPGVHPWFSGDHHLHGQLLEENLALFFKLSCLNFQQRHFYCCSFFPLTPFIKSAQLGWWGQNQIQILGDRWWFSELSHEESPLHLCSVMVSLYVQLLKPLAFFFSVVHHWNCLICSLLPSINCL